MNFSVVKRGLRDIVGRIITNGDGQWKAVGQGAKMVVVKLAVRLMAMVQLDDVKKR